MTIFNDYVVMFVHMIAASTFCIIEITLEEYFAIKFINYNRFKKKIKLKMCLQYVQCYVVQQRGSTSAAYWISETRHLSSWAQFRLYGNMEIISITRVKNKDAVWEGKG